MAKRLISPTQFIDRFVKKTETGHPLVLTPEQRKILDAAFGLLAFWTLFLYSTVKKSGKTLINGLLVLWWAFTHPNDEILLLANDQEQSIGRVHKVIAGLIRHNPLLAVEAQVLSSTIRFQNGTICNALTNEASTAAGANQGLSSWDELWGFQSERGRRLWEELTPVPNKPSKQIVTTYAGFDGESTLLWNLYLMSVGKDEHKDGQGTRVHDSLPIYLNSEAKVLCYWDHLPRLPWQTQQYYAAQKRTLRPTTYLRLHENRWVSAESTFILPEQWDACVDPEHTPLLFSDSAIDIGIDIGVKSDTSAVVGVCWDEAGTKVRTAFHKIWKPTKGNPVNLDEVKSFIREICQRLAVRSLVADPSQAFLLIQQLAQEGILISEFPQTLSNTVKMGETLFSMVKDRNLIAYPSAELREHVLNAVGIETPSGIRMVKGKTSKKIDAAIALSMALVSAVSMGPGASLADFLAANAGAPQRFFNPDRGGWIEQDRADDGLHPMDVLIDNSRKEGWDL